MGDYIEQHSTINNFSICCKSWSILSDIEQRIKGKIEEVGVPLQDWNIQINYGIKTGLNEAFIISGEKKNELIAEDPKSAEIIRPILRGRDIKRYGYDFADLWLINVHNGISKKGIPRAEVNDYPVIKKHLDIFFDKLERRYDKGDTPYNLRSCDYLDDFYKQKIAYNDINQRLSFAFVEPGIFFNNTVYFIAENKHMKYLLACLNSNIVNWYYKTLSVQLGEKAVRMFSIYVINIPLPVVSKNEENEFENLVDKKFSSDEERKQAEETIEVMLSNIYGLNEEERDFLQNQ